MDKSKPAGPPLDDANVSEFTQANLIGLFLTLGLCLLTQPWGSLLYRPLNNSWPIFARLIFFVWRLHPLACAAEAVIIVSCYVDTILETRKQCIDQGKKMTYSDIRHALHISSSALLLLRANDDSDGPVEVLLEEQLLSCSDTTEVELNPDTTETATTGTEGLLQQRTTDIEANTAQQPASPPTHTHPVPYLTTLIPAHKESWLDTMATFSVLTITLKLLTTSLPWPFRLAAFLLLLGWLSVQSLLYFHHLSPTPSPPFSPSSSNYPTLKSIISLAARHRTHTIPHRLTLVAMHLVALPLLLYIAYAVGISAGYPLPKSDFWAGTPDNDRLYRLGIPGLKPLFSPVEEGGGGIDDSPSEIRFIMYMPVTIPVWTLAMLLVFIPFLGPAVAVAGAILKYASSIKLAGVAYGVICIGQLVWSVHGFGLNPEQAKQGELYLLCGSCGISAGVWTWLGLALPVRFFGEGGGGVGEDYYRGLGRRRNWQRSTGEGAATGVCLSTIAWFYLFVWAVEHYDRTGTFKPAWLEYLG